jgi:hypothetical protein
MQNYEDWWRLHVDDATGLASVEHEWSHTDIGKLANPRNGQQTFSVDEFMQSNEPQAAKDQLQTIIAELGLA